ncbi:aromatic acid/H+ symport family MFS transporter [Amycolatopsis endophytica]|uniref:AAHS family benzoate transporter-like MFS transporter n=1 Tax=Amycolatopsis endophytica TaxID=860233 RepID=A0A853BAE3_9PSEU|nr:MFS transporter [Amycolatopsis endophytica]NYI92318.1 AAHS family benzoate transporter-like MFS transporter [Amycolatopsis endophytica]
MSSLRSPSPTPSGRTPIGVVLLGLACLTLEGYDVVSYGAALPYLLADPSWHVTVAQASLLGSLTPVGMLVGAIGAGVLTDRIGRRNLILASVALFSTAMLASGLSPGVAVFAVGRVLVGLGVGGVLPSVAALVFEFSAPHRRSLNVALSFAGVSIGGALAAVVAATVVPVAGFRAEFLVGGLAALLVLPAALRWLPESLVYLRAVGRESQARRWIARLRLDPALAAAASSEPDDDGGRGRLTTVFSRRYAVTTALFCLVAFASLLVLFGIYTWLPQLMRSVGYETGSALTFLLVLNLGTAVGSPLLAWLADRTGPKPVLVVAFLLAVVGIVVLSTGLPLVLLYVAVVLAGIGTVGTQILLNVFVASRYPVRVRATAIGAALSVGRLGAILGPLYGGALLSAELPTAWLFYGFAAPALAGALLVALVPRGQSRTATSAVDPAAGRASR